MTKSVFIESVLLKINGGQLTDEASVLRVDIAAYIPAAVNYTLEAGYNIQLQTEGNRDFSSLFYGYFADQPILIDAARNNRKYINYPKKPIALRSNQGVRHVEDGCNTTYKPLSDAAVRTIAHYENILTGASYYRPEATKIYLFNVPPLVESVGVVIIVDVDDLTDDDLLPIPAGLETMALDKCYEYMFPERTNPADRNTDKRDIN